jgi:hypothetical protein
LMIHRFFSSASGRLRNFVDWRSGGGARRR